MADPAGTPVKPKKVKTPPEVCEQIYQMSREGMSIGDIAEQTGVRVPVVSGLIQTAKNQGKVPKTPPLSPEVRMSQPSLPPVVPSGAQPAPYGVLPTSVDSVRWRSSGPGSPGGFQFSNQQIRYFVKRIIPNDGLLGTHAHPFEIDDLGRLYGQGTYELTRQEPGKLPQVSDPISISQSYGRTRYPNDRQDAAARNDGRRPWERTYGRDGRSDPDDDQGAEAPRVVQRVQVPVPGFDPRFTEFARQRTNEDSVGVAVINSMTKMQEATIKENADLRKSGPDSWLQQFFMTGEKAREDERKREETKREDDRGREEKRRDDERKREEGRREDERKREEDRQTEIARIRDDDRKREEARRDDERKRDDSRRQEAEMAYTRRLAEEDKKHDREMERIRQESESRAKFEKEQRETLLQLEQKKVEVIEKQANAREELMQKELQRTREDWTRQSKELTDQMQGVQASVEAQLGKDREGLKREFDLRNKALDNEHALRAQMLQLREETSQRGEGEAFTKMVEKIVSEVGKNVKEVIEYKKLEMTAALSPEGQAAVMSQKSQDGNIKEPPERIAGQATAQVRATPEARSQVSTNGNGHLDDGLDKSEREQKVEKMIGEMLKEPFLKEVLSEWSRHIAKKRPATMFSNLFIEWMRDPSDDKGRKGCAAFATVVDSRTWEEMFPLLKPGMSPEILKIFEEPEAEEFYESFRAIIGESVRDYFEQWLTERQAKREREQQATPAP